jgi:hypothetical protein
VKDGRKSRSPSAPSHDRTTRHKPPVKIRDGSALGEPGAVEPAIGRLGGPGARVEEFFGQDPVLALYFPIVFRRVRFGALVLRSEQRAANASAR